MPTSRLNQNILLRICISFAALLIPFFLLYNKIFGSFLFTFSIPLIWQAGVRGKPIDYFVFRRVSARNAIVAGIISGCVLGFLGGNMLKLLGITGKIFTQAHKLQFSIGTFQMEFSLEKELGYQLLGKSDTPIGAGVYFLFSIFVIGLGEEIFWRGFLLKKIATFLSRHAAIWVSAVLFAAIHFYIFAVLSIPAGISFLTLIAIAGACWGYLFLAFNTIWPAAISHGVAAFILWKYYFF